MKKINTQLCELCKTPGGVLIWQDAVCRVVRVEDLDYPGFCRVILNAHVKEMTDVEDDARQRLMQVVFGVEASIRAVLRPDKVNLASLGNMTPHVHWHVIPRYSTDKHFPNPIWGSAMREQLPHALDPQLAEKLHVDIQQRLGD